jgi:hypothetical protein
LLKSVKGTKNIPWLYNTGAQATCLSEKLFRKISKEDKPKKMLKSRRFIGAG